MSTWDSVFPLILRGQFHGSVLVVLIVVWDRHGASWVTERQLLLCGLYLGLWLGMCMPVSRGLWAHAPLLCPFSGHCKPAATPMVTSETDFSKYPQKSCRWLFQVSGWRGCVLTARVAFVYGSWSLLPLNVCLSACRCRVVVWGDGSPPCLYTGLGFLLPGASDLPPSFSLSTLPCSTIHPYFIPEGDDKGKWHWWAWLWWQTDKKQHTLLTLQL